MSSHTKYILMSFLVLGLLMVLFVSTLVFLYGVARLIWSLGHGDGIEYGAEVFVGFMSFLLTTILLRAISDEYG